MLQFVRLGDESYTLSSIDNSKCFGIQLTKSDLEKILKNELLFNLLLEKQKISGKELKILTSDLFIGVLGEELIKNIKEQCLGCKSNDVNTEHDCKTYFRNRADRTKLIEKINNSNIFEIKFSQSFDKLMNLLNIRNPDRIEQIQLYLPDLKKDIEFSIQKLGYFIDLREGASIDVMHVLSLV